MGVTPRRVGTVLLLAGVLGLGWALTVWVWQDPFTALYTTWQQHRLEAQLDHEFRTYAPRRGKHIAVAREQALVAGNARRFASSTHEGMAIGRIRIPRMGLDMVVVDGTDEASLQKGPGRYLSSAMPGEKRLVYIAGHRTTFLAPFSHIDRMRTGDRITLELPYATFVYRVTGHRIVPADDLSVLRSPDHELLELQACHPRFSASHRYIVYALPTLVEPRGLPAYRPARAGSAPRSVAGRRG